MKKNIVSVLVLVVMAVGIFLVSSCNSGGKTYPTIAFRVKTDSITYLSSYVSLPRDTIFTIYINANRTGPDAILTNFKISRSVNGGVDSTLLNAQLNTVYFGQFYSYQAGDSGDVQQYTFTVANNEGLYNSIQFTDTAR